MTKSSPPSISKCLSMMEEYDMLANIQAHSFVVGRVAERIIDRLVLQGKAKQLPAPDLVTAGALLHDIAKTRCLQENCDHAITGAEICAAHGFDDVAEIVRDHVMLRDFAMEKYRLGVFSAKEIIFYADKRVVHDSIVSLGERLEYILARYGKGDNRRQDIINRNFHRCKMLEEWICHYAACSPDELLRNIRILPYSRENK